MQDHILQEAECLVTSMNFLRGKVILVSVRERAVPSSTRTQSQIYWLHNWLGTAEDAENTSCCSLYLQPSESYSGAEC